MVSVTQAHFCRPLECTQSIFFFWKFSKSFKLFHSFLDSMHELKSVFPLTLAHGGAILIVTGSREAMAQLYGGQMRAHTQDLAVFNRRLLVEKVIMVHSTKASCKGNHHHISAVSDSLISVKWNPFPLLNCVHLSFVGFLCLIYKHILVLFQMGCKNKNIPKFMWILVVSNTIIKTRLSKTSVGFLFSV